MPASKTDFSRATSTISTRLPLLADCSSPTPSPSIFLPERPVRLRELVRRQAGAPAARSGHRGGICGSISRPLEGCTESGPRSQGEVRRGPEGEKSGPRSQGEARQADNHVAPSGSLTHDERMESAMTWRARRMSPCCQRMWWASPDPIETISSSRYAANMARKRTIGATTTSALTRHASQPRRRETASAQGKDSKRAVSSYT